MKTITLCIFLGMQTIKINMVTSRLCNPKVQNKLEQSHLELQKKFHYD